MRAEAAKQNRKALDYVDLEFRTDALLRTVGLVEELFVGEDSDRIYTCDGNTTPSGDETTYVVIHGKGTPAQLAWAWNMARRIVETAWYDDDEMTRELEVWNCDPLVGCMEMTIAPDNPSFTMSFFCNGDKDIDWGELFSGLFDGIGWDEAPELFVITGMDRSHEPVHSCEFYDRMNGDIATERDWKFSVSDGGAEMYESHDLFETFVEARHISYGLVAGGSGGAAAL